MTKTKLFTISVILLVLAIVLPICLVCLGEEALTIVDSISALIGAFCGVITLLIAILLYNKYGIDQSITDKNLKVVLDIIDELKKATVIAYCDTNNGAYFYQLNFCDTSLSEFTNNNVHSSFDDAVYFKISYAYAFDRLYELSRDPFVPKEISEAISGIQLYMLSEIKKENLAGRYAIIHVRSNEPVENEGIIGKFNNKDMTLRQFIENYLKVKNAIKTWLINHSVNSDSLNF